MPLIDSLQARLFGKRWIAVADAPRHVAVPTQAGMRELCCRHGFDPGSFSIAADSALSNGALIPMSLIHSSSTTNSYASRRWLATCQRLVAAAGILPAWFAAAIENRLAPAQCLALMQKPR